MSRLEELIQELCPNGVEYKSLGDAVVLERGKRVVKKELSETEGYPVYQNSLTPLGYYKESNQVKDTTFVIVAGAAGDIGYSKVDFWAADDCFVVRCPNNLSDRYVYHVLLNQQQLLKGKVRKASVPRLPKTAIDKLVIPVPPLEVQRKIVRILDDFTELTAELQKELTAELTARKKQYEYYRDQLFEFDESIPHIQLKDLAKINIGLATSVTQHKCDNGVILIHNSDIQQNVIRLKSIEFISEDFAKKHEKKRLRKGDIITVHTGDVGTSAVIGDQFDGAIGFTTITTRIQDKEIINEFYLCHYFNSYRCKKDISLMTISDRSNLNQKSFEKLLIPVPSIEQQRRIVTILNRFDVICNDLKNGLPAEVEARKKQYEYYRDTLLNFERFEE